MNSETRFVSETKFVSETCLASESSFVPLRSGPASLAACPPSGATGPDARTSGIARRWLQLSAGSVLGSVLMACGGGSGGQADTPPPPAQACLAAGEQVLLTGGLQGWDEWHDVVIDRQANVWLAGEVSPTPAQTGRDALLQKRGPAGNLLAHVQTPLSTPADDALTALAIAADGTVYVGGHTRGDFAAGNRGQYDGLIAWLPAGADAQTGWKRLQFGNSLRQELRQLRLDSAGRLLAVGTDIDTRALPEDQRLIDPWVRRWQRVGAGTAGERLDSMFAFEYDTPGLDYGLTLTTGSRAPDVDAVYAGSSRQGATGPGMLLDKLSADGQHRFRKQYSSDARDRIVAVAQAGDGGLLIAGTVNGDFAGVRSNGHNDVFIAEVDAGSGDLRWAKLHGTASDEFLSDMKIGADGRLYLHGSTGGVMAPGARNAGGQDAFVLKLDRNGALLDARQWGSPDYEWPNRLVVDACGGVVAVGASGASSTGGEQDWDGYAWFWPAR